MSQQEPTEKYYFSSYTNINGQEQRLEKEFDSKDEYETFLKENKVKMPSFNFSFPVLFGTRGFLPSFGWDDPCFDGLCERPSAPALSAPTQDLVELKRKKIERERKKAQLETLIKDAQEISDYFEKEGDNESATKAKDIVKKYQDALAE